MSTDRFNEQHSRPRELSGGTLYAVRGPHRPLRVGDRVRDDHLAAIGAVGPLPSSTRRNNYPGSHYFGTITRITAHGITVSYDDGYVGPVDADHLSRL